MFTDLLIRIFVKDYKNIGKREVRQRYGYLSGYAGIISNIILFLLKISIGLYLNSIAVMADAFNNLSDVGSSVVTIFGFMMSGKPADKEHPFGHGRFEYIAAMVVSLMVIVVGFEFVKSSIKKIVDPEELRFNIFTFILLLSSIAVKVWLAFFNRKIGRTIGSKVMEATAFDSLSDVAATSVVALSLLASRWIAVPIDGYVGLAVSIFILYNGYNLIKETLNPLLGEAPDENLVKSIIEKTLSYKGVIGIHDLIVHNYGPGRIVASIHAEMPYSMDIMEAHDIIDQAEKEISEELGLHLVIHMDPINTDDKLVQTAKAHVIDILKDFPHELTIHDFRVVGNEKHMNVIFDMVVPYEFKEKDEKELIEEVKNAIKERHPNYDAIITIDRQYSLLK